MLAGGRSMSVGNPKTVTMGDSGTLGLSKENFGAKSKLFGVVLEPFS